MFNDQPKRILFVCVENSNRSQMAEAFTKIHGDERFTADSAGSRPSGKINPRAVESMKELGYDLSQHRSKSLDDVKENKYDAVVTMGCGDACPNIPADRREDWQIPDPREMNPDQFRSVRDLIAGKVKVLLESFD